MCKIFYYFYYYFQRLFNLLISLFISGNYTRLAGLVVSNGRLIARFMALVTCGLTVKDRHQLQNPTLILSMWLPLSLPQWVPHRPLVLWDFVQARCIPLTQLTVSKHRRNVHKILDNSLSLSLSPFSRWTWVSRCLLKLRMEVVATTVAINRAKLQSNHHNQ